MHFLLVSVGGNDFLFTIDEPLKLTSIYLSSPSGNWITTAQRQPHRQVVLFFEKNGLRRGEFILSDNNATVSYINYL
jgi:hypothetical protein